MTGSSGRMSNHYTQQRGLEPDGSPQAIGGTPVDELRGAALAPPIGLLLG